MKAKYCLMAVTAVLIPTILFAAFKKGDLVETRGGKSGIWFPGKVASVDGGKIMVSSFGWEQNVVEISKNAIRPITRDGDVVVRKGGSVWAIVSADGTIRINGSIVGSLADDGTVRKNGSIVGSVAMNGEVWKGGSMKGSVWPTSELYTNSGVVGSIDNVDGTIRRGGSIWGSVDNFSRKFRDMRAAFAVIAFFSNEFGY
jgi:hypothetical protein